GVQFLPSTWNEAREILIKLHQEHGPWLILQEFEENLLSEGETRVFLIGGKICGALNKHPHPKHPIISLDVQTQEQPQIKIRELTPQQQQRADAIAQA